MVPMCRHARRAALLILVLATPALCQTPPPRLSPPVNLTGPRFGFTALSDRLVAKLAAENVQIRPLITQFGWQFENRFYGGGNGLTAVSEFVVLAGGLEQGVAIPSLSWLAGLRTKEGAEFGVGPNFSPAGAALVIAAGTTFRSGALNFPVNVAVTPSRLGMRVSVLAGFNGRH